MLKQHPLFLKISKNRAWCLKITFSIFFPGFINVVRFNCSDVLDIYVLYFTMLDISFPAGILLATRAPGAYQRTGWLQAEVQQRASHGLETWFSTSSSTSSSHIFNEILKVRQLQISSMSSMSSIISQHLQSAFRIGWGPRWCHQSKGLALAWGLPSFIIYIYIQYNIYIMYTYIYLFLYVYIFIYIYPL